MSDIVERLRHTNDAMLVVGQDYSDVLLDAAHEIERLRAADRLMVAQFLDQEREATRLRRLLREWLDGETIDTLPGIYDFVKRVREALGDDR